MLALPQEQGQLNPAASVELKGEGRGTLRVRSWRLISGVVKLFIFEVVFVK
jgi:hypothetical protein